MSQDDEAAGFDAAQAQALLAAIVASSDDAIVSKTLQGVITSWNAGAERLFGHTAAQAVGQPILLVIPPDRHHEENTILERIHRGERVEHFETVRQTRDGRLIDVSITVSPVRDASGKIIGASKIARDISVRRQVERVLADESRIFGLLNETGAALASNLQLHTLLQAVTDTTTRLSGAQFGAFFYNAMDEQGGSYLLHTLSGAPKEAFEKFGQPRATPLFAPTFQGQGTIRLDNVREDPRYGQWAPHHGMPKGHLPVCSYLAVPVISRSGDVIGGLFFGHSEPAMFNARHERLVAGVAAQAAIAIDNARLYEAAQKAAEERERLLAAERRAREELEQANRSKDAFLATLSHELRTPLNAILGWAQVLRRGNAREGDLAQGAEAIERNARVQAQLIEDLLDMSRITSGKLRLDIQTVHLAQCVEAAVETVRPSAAAKALRLETMLDPLAGPVLGDPNRLQQILWNLLSNAVKFTPRYGRIQVLLERVNSHIEISVADTGIGITPEFLPHVFERFQQSDSSTTRRHGGLGLGLSIVKHLVELHGGSVRAKSGGPDRGATFVVQLPLPVVQRGETAEPRRHPQQFPTGQPADLPQPSLSGLKVLVTDDEADARALIKRVLEGAGAEVLAASSAEEALRLVPNHHPDVLISDIGMPDVDGYTLLRRLRAARCRPSPSPPSPVPRTAPVPSTPASWCTWPSRWSPPSWWRWWPRWPAAPRPAEAPPPGCGGVWRVTEPCAGASALNQQTGG